MAVLRWDYTHTGILRTPLVQFPDALNWVLVEGKIASDRISAFLSEGRAVEYRALSGAPTTTRHLSSTGGGASTRAATRQPN